MRVKFLIKKMYSNYMNIKNTMHNCLMLLACLLLLNAGAVSAADDSALSVGYESLSSSKENPKSKNVGSITAKYGFGSSKEIKPYLGTGLAYSYAEPVKQGEAVPGLKTSLAGQAGVNFMLRDNVSLSVDYKFLNLQPEARPSGNDPSTQKLGIGLDIKF